ncbi:hypothetical protein [Bifidobacterium amazonense]|nr:hypothetical protein [Bifidobacterium amazonense]
MIVASHSMLFAFAGLIAGIALCYALMVTGAFVAKRTLADWDREE